MERPKRVWIARWPAARMDRAMGRDRDSSSVRRWIEHCCGVCLRFKKTVRGAHTSIPSLFRAGIHRRQAGRRLRSWGSMFNLGTKCDHFAQGEHQGLSLGDRRRPSQLDLWRLDSPAGIPRHSRAAPPSSPARAPFVAPPHRQAAHPLTCDGSPRIILALMPTTRMLHAVN